MTLNRTIDSKAKIIEALKKMDELDCKLLIVLNNKLFDGLISIGDIQRGIINNIPLENSISTIQRKTIKIAKPEDNIKSIKKMMLDYRMEFCPVVNENNEIVNVFYWEDLFPNQKVEVSNKFNIPVVLMAGGVGSRLRPLTYVLPKPLIPIGEKTIMQEIFDRFFNYGCNQMYTSINYKADFIKEFINKLNLPYQIKFFEEDQPMGTAGSLQLLKKKINSTFFVHNCDILIDGDYSEMLEFHNDNGNEITIIAAIKHFSLAYGTIETGLNGELISISEKPEYTFKVNSGLYILEPNLLNEIPENKFFHITDLITNVKKRNGKIGVYPVSENSWKDIGNWDEYLKIIKKNTFN